MQEPTPKIDLLRAAMRAGDWRKAIGHRREVPPARCTQGGHHPRPKCMLEPAFYEQIGQDPAALVEVAKQALIARYGLARGRRPKPTESKVGETFRQTMRCGETNEGVISMTNANTESLVVEFKKEVAKMREREATDIEIQSMLEFVEQLTHWRGDVDREPLINALREAARR